MQSFCWREIGISGDRSCVELATLIHCRNCSIYTQTARQVFDRPLPELSDSLMYGASDSMAVSSERSSERSDLENGRDPDDEMGRNAIAIFRLEQEWFSLPATMFHSIVPWRKVRPIPHRSNELLQGLVNVRGELLLCVSLAQFLKVTKGSNHGSPIQAQRRLAIIEWEGNRWSFPVDEFQGIETISHSRLLTPPATVLKADQTYTHSLLPWHDRLADHPIDRISNCRSNRIHSRITDRSADRTADRSADRVTDRTINCLDETLLFDALTRKATQ